MSKYLSCPFSFDQHYNKRVRPCKIGSPLVFGVGIDEGLNVVLEGGTVEAAMQAFTSAMERYPYGKMRVGKWDYDRDLVPVKKKKKALDTLKTFGYMGKDIDDLFATLIDKEELSENQSKAIDFIARLSFRFKAKVLFKAYKEQVMPKIKKVHAIQKSSKVGILDLKADWERVGNTYIIDNKTASMEYAEDAADYSIQLTIYADEENIDNVMFIVLPKKLDKRLTRTCEKCGTVARGMVRTCNAFGDDGTSRCNGKFTRKVVPSAQIQIVKGKVTKLMKQRAREIRDSVQKAVDNKIFPCNFSTCGNKFGRPCEYRDLYYKGDMKGLEVVPESDRGKK